MRRANNACGAQIIVVVMVCATMAIVSVTLVTMAPAVTFTVGVCQVTVHQIVMTTVSALTANVSVNQNGMAMHVRKTKSMLSQRNVSYAMVLNAVDTAFAN